MKKIILAIAIVFILGFGASAQKDGFFGWYASDNDTYRISEGGDNFVLPTDHGTGMDQGCSSRHRSANPHRSRWRIRNNPQKAIKQLNSQIFSTSSQLRVSSL